MKLHLVFFALAIFGLGFLASIGYDYYFEEDPEYRGLWTRNKFNFKGSWVHVNINDMDFERAVEFCKHETFHEIFAECGEKNEPEECFDNYLDYKYNDEE